MSVRDCFISHASEDKEAIARPLAHALRERGYEVWYDEFELEPGDSLPGKIDEGLAASRFGVVVLSERFFAKNWTKLELDALVTRQMIGSERIILPVWHEIDDDYLEKVSPTLASIVGVPSAPLDVAVERIAKRIDKRRDSGSSGAALVFAQESKPAPSESDPEKLVSRRERVKLGYSDLEKSKFAPDGAGGHYDRGPGWLSVIVGPASFRDDLIDPTELSGERLRDLEIDDQWYREALCNRRGLRAGLDGFVHRWPEDPSAPPDYWLKIWQDGLLEYGESLTLSVDEKRLIPYISFFGRLVISGMLSRLRHSAT
jgi:TIR domain